MMQSPYRIGLLDDHQIVADALASRLKREVDLDVVCVAYDTGPGLVSMIAAAPDLFILDIELPGLGAFEAATILRDACKNARLIFLTGFVSSGLVEHALRVGAMGYVRKGESTEGLLNSIRKVIAGEFSFSQEVLDLLHLDPSRNRYEMRSLSPLSVLTSRQVEVLRLLARGESVKEVAKTMHLSQKSVDSHKYRIMSKLGIHDRVQLARFAIREGLMQP